MAIEDVTPEQLEGVSDEEHYPDLEDVLRRLLDDPDVPFGPVARVEVTTQGTGEATYRVWPVKSGEATEGHWTSVSSR